jgi:hypothetical protein
VRRLKKKTILAGFALAFLLLLCSGGCEPFLSPKKGGLIVIVAPPSSSFSYNVEIYYNYELLDRYVVKAKQLKICSVDLDGDYQLYYHAAPAKPTKLLAKIKIKGGETLEVKIPLPSSP